MIFFEKNKIDLDRGSEVTITITDSVASNTGQDSVDYLRNRNNDSGWGTTGSSDAANTQMDIEFGGEYDVNRLFFLQQNWKAYTCKYSLAGGSLTDFSTAINVSANTEADKYHSFDTVALDHLRIIISQAMTTNDDKFCSQIIATELIGSLSSIQPLISNVVFGRNRKFVKALSGKGRVKRNIGSVGFRLSKENIKDATDWALLSTLHDYHNGFLVWPNGNADSTQSAEHAAILNARTFWRRRDIFLMDVASELEPGFASGRFGWGQNADIDFKEAL